MPQARGAPVERSILGQREHSALVHAPAYLKREWLNGTWYLEQILPLTVLSFHNVHSNPSKTIIGGDAQAGSGTEPMAVELMIEGVPGGRAAVITNQFVGLASSAGRLDQYAGIPTRYQQLDCLQNRRLTTVIRSNQQVDPGQVSELVALEAPVGLQSERANHSRRPPSALRRADCSRWSFGHPKLSSPPPARQSAAGFILPNSRRATAVRHSTATSSGWSAPRPARSFPHGRGRRTGNP